MTTNDNLALKTAACNSSFGMLKGFWVLPRSWPYQMHISLLHWHSRISNKPLSRMPVRLHPKDMKLNSRWTVWDMTIETGDAKL